jgi:hypothetical protein
MLRPQRFSLLVPIVVALLFRLRRIERLQGSERARELYNFDEALANYLSTYEKDPGNHEYRLSVERARSQTGLAHLELGSNSEAG